MATTRIQHVPDAIAPSVRPTDRKGLPNEWHVDGASTRPLRGRTNAPCHMTVRLRDGGSCVLRPLRAGELDVLDDVFAGLSHDSRRERYLVPMPRLPASSRRQLADVDGYDHVAWVALLGGEPAGICRYVRTTKDTAEVAVEVVDAAQGRGVGSTLVDAVTTAAQANGVIWLEAVVRPGNHASVRLMSKVGIDLVLEDGLLMGRGRLRLLGPPPRVNRRAVRILAAAAAAASLGELVIADPEPEARVAGSATT